MRSRGLIIALFLLSLFVSSCREIMSFSDGSSVRFSASSAFPLLTKTEYAGGYVKDGDYERINWLSGDRITIISPDCVVYDKSVTPWQPRLTHASPYYSEADYVIASNGTPDGRYSTSSITDADAGEKGLHWWPDQEISGQARPNHYVFFGVYPSPYALVDSVKAVTDFTTNAESTKGIITAYLPKVQKYSKVSTPVSSVRNSSVDSTHVYPQMEYAWMWSAQYAPKAEENVKMFFSPMVTTFQIAVTGLDATDVPISKFQLVSENHALQGTFVATMTVGRDAVDRDHLDRMSVEYSGIPSRIAGNNDEVTFLLPEGTVVSSTKKVTFTVFVYPEGSSSSAVLDGLSLRFVSPGITRSLKLKYSASAPQNAGSWVQFPAGRKINIDGITLPRQEDPWTFTVTGEDWEEELSDIVVTPVQITEHENQEGGSLEDLSRFDGGTEDYGTGNPLPFK